MFRLSMIAFGYGRCHSCRILSRGTASWSPVLPSKRIQEIQERAQIFLIDHFEKVQIPLIEAEIGSRSGALRKLLWSFPFYAVLTDVAAFDDGRLENMIRHRLALDNIHRSESLVWQSFIRMVHFANMERCKLQSDYPIILASPISPPINNEKELGLQSRQLASKTFLPLEKSLVELESQANALCHLLWDQRYLSSRKIPIPVFVSAAAEESGPANNNAWNVLERAKSLGLRALGFPLAGILLVITINHGFTGSLSGGNWSLLITASSIIMGTYFL